MEMLATSFFMYADLRIARLLRSGRSSSFPFRHLYISEKKRVLLSLLCCRVNKSLTSAQRMFQRNTSLSEETLLFAKNFLQHPKMLGSLIPSSRFLVDGLLSKIDWGGA